MTEESVEFLVGAGTDYLRFALQVTKAYSLIVDRLAWRSRNPPFPLLRSGRSRSIQILHYKKGFAVLLADVVNGADVRVIR